MKSIADKIRYQRKYVLGISQELLAQKVNVERKTVSNWEQGICKPKGDNVKVLAQIFHVSIDYLLFDYVEEELSLRSIDDEQYEILKQIIDYFNKKNSMR